MVGISFFLYWNRKFQLRCNR